MRPPSHWHVTRRGADNAFTWWVIVGAVAVVVAVALVGRMIVAASGDSEATAGGVSLPALPGSNEAAADCPEHICATPTEALVHVEDAAAPAPDVTARGAVVMEADCGEMLLAKNPDAQFAPAYAALAEAHVWFYSGLGVLPADETVPHARRAVDRALALDANLAQAWKVRGLIAMNHDWDRREAEHALTRALQLGPGSASAHLWNAWRLALLEQRHDLALIELEEAERLDPLDLQVKTQIGYVHHFRHDLDRAIAQFEKVVALEPSFAFAHYALGDACTQRGHFDRAIAEFNKSIELGGRSVNHVGVLGYAYGRSGNRERAKAHLNELIAQLELGRQTRRGRTV